MTTTAVPNTIHPTEPAPGHQENAVLAPNDPSFDPEVTPLREWEIVALTPGEDGRHAVINRKRQIVRELSPQEAQTLREIKNARIQHRLTAHNRANQQVLEASGIVPPTRELPENGQP